MPQNQASFALLQFSRLFDDEQLELLLLDRKDGGHLEVWIRPDWAKRINEKDRGYLSALIAEWRKSKREHLPSLLAELRELSHGPLRVVSQGEVPVPELPSLIGKTNV